MSLFQPSILSKHINALDKAVVGKQWEIFKAHFHNPVIQENIRQSKEEQYQEGFLRDLFVSVFGYTLNPSAGYNLTTEYKNVKDSKKADGAILSSTRGHAPLSYPSDAPLAALANAPLLSANSADSPSVRAIIELKGNDTTDLDKIEPQAFGYKNNQPECKYIIISNFEKLRFYIENTVDFIEFNLFTLTETEFQILWLCLACKNMMDDIPALIKNASVSKEEDITKQLYKDYSLFKRELYQNMVKLNPQHDELELFRKSQKLLDRILFLLFGEDRYLLPPNAVRKILEQWEMLKDNDAYFPLYERFKMYFGHLNIGKQGKQYDIFAYNGGLFKPDEVLDNVEIDDELLYTHTLKLSAYNFQSDVDVNILGHIFENSLNEIDEIKAQLEGKEIDKAQTKRKKDGVYYTPKYITKYIVENTVGRLCTEKKAELGIVEEEYTVDKKRPLATKKALINQLTQYRDWLLQITIVDPACGSGAFLNQALVFLMEEHQYIDELEAKITGSSLVFSNIENSILENNLFGVDLNEESVEIAKLSLWLRTAKPNRKLNDLNSNIKCGNSLIDDPEVAGDKAFNWQTEFPQVFTLKDKRIWHVTTATHNSRYSQRMFDCHIAVGEAEWIDTEDELIITQAIAEIAKDELNIVEYNLCVDHMHLLLVCETEELPGIVGKIKSITAEKRNLARGYSTSTRGHAPLAEEEGEKLATTRGHAPLSETGTSRGETQHSLWTQKFGKTEVMSEEYLLNTMEYIRTNRTKHELPENPEMEKIKKSFVCTIEHALRPEYKGGFDVVIGNPPYVQLSKVSSTTDEEKRYLMKRYETSAGRLNTFIFFIHLLSDICKKGGYGSFIIPNTILTQEYYFDTRKMILEKLNLYEIVQYSFMPFIDAIVENITMFFSKGNNIDNIKLTDQTPTNNTYLRSLNKLTIQNAHKNIIELKTNFITEKLDKIETKLENFVDINQGIALKGDKTISVKNEYHPTYYKLIDGKHINKYSINWGGDYLEYDIERIHSCKRKDIFESNEKLFFRRVSANLIFTFDDQKYYALNTLIVVNLLPKTIINIKTFLAILNSKLLNFYYIYKYKSSKTVFSEIQARTIKLLPIPNITDDYNSSFILKADLMLSLNNDLQLLVGKFQRNMQREFGLQSLTGKLQSWHDLSYPDFLRELAKAKVSLTLSQKAEWEDYFTAEQQKAQNLKQQIAATDSEIDRMVYELYGLTEEEIRIVEGE